MQSQEYLTSIDFQQGDLVLKLTETQKKHTFQYDPKPWVVIDTLGSQISIRQGKTILMRHKDNFFTTCRQSFKIRSYIPAQMALIAVQQTTSCQLL